MLVTTVGRSLVNVTPMYRDLLVSPRLSPISTGAAVQYRYWSMLRVYCLPCYLAGPLYVFHVVFAVETHQGISRIRLLAPPVI